MAKYITDIEAVTLGQLSSIHNWVAGRVELRTSYELQQGKQRRYFHDNVLELAFVVALIKAGLKASSAVAYSDMFRRLRQSGALPRFFGFADGDPERGKSDDASAIEQWQHWFPGCVSLCLIPVREIADRVDAYFAAHGVEA